MQRKITGTVSEEQLQLDLNKYRQRAIQLGATDAKIINSDDVIIDERVVAKCAYPKCPSYGTNANCPPYAMTPEQMKKVVSNFRYGVFIKLDVPPEHTAGSEAMKKNLLNPYRRKMLEIIAKIESEAFYDGYYLALGFSGGPCKRVFCPDVDCQALLTGQGCPHRLKARSAMEAHGMDAYAMATNAGWDIYSIGYATLPSEVPYGLRLGLILITLANTRMYNCTHSIL
jgi:predicted metal-binding protein